MTATLNLFDTVCLPTPLTEGIKYAGSKLKILPHISQMIADLPIRKVLDGFSGSTRVAQFFAKLNYDITANDTAIWSKTFATAYLLNNKKPERYQKLIDHLNGLVGYDGWFTEHYGGEIFQPQNKRPFQRKNTQKLDAIRDEIEKLNLSSIEKAVALTSLILALDAVDSTLGHYVSYLAAWSPRSYNDLCLKVPKLFVSTGKNRVLHGDIFTALQDNEYDLAYFDPPYGSNNDKMPPSRVRYNAYYHLWKTVILNDRPEIFGKANRRIDSRDEIAASIFEDFRKDENKSFIALQAIKKLITSARAKFILLSYSSGGRATKEELFTLLQDSGELLNVVEIDYKKNVMGNMRWTNEWINSDRPHCEYLFLLAKN